MNETEVASLTRGVIIGSALSAVLWVLIISLIWGIS